MNEPRSSLFSPRVALGAAIVGSGVAMFALVACAPDNYKPPFSSWSASEEAKPEAEGAQSAPAVPGGDHTHHMPPPQAFDACKAKSAGEMCNVQLGDNEIAGKCEEAPPGAVQGGLACRPDGEGRRHHGPPPEFVFAACTGKTAGDACTVDHEGRTLNGACMMPKREGGGDRLLCAPTHPHKGGMGGDGKGSPSWTTSGGAGGGGGMGGGGMGGGEAKDGG